MNVKELRTLVDNLDEYINVPGGVVRLKKMVLHLAVSGQLVPQDQSEGTGEELYQQIRAEKAELIKQNKAKIQKVLPGINDDEMLANIPLTWAQVRVGDASIYQQRGKSPKYTDESDFPVVSQRCVRWDRIDWQFVKFITSDSIDKYEEFRFLRSGDLLLNSTGTGTMGRVGIYRENSDYERVVADSHVTVVRFGTHVLADFAHMFFRSPLIQEDVESKASGSTNQIEWNLSSIQREVLPLPPYAEQRRIVAKIDTIFALIDDLAEKYNAEQAERTKLVASSLARLSKGDGDLALSHLTETIRTRADAKVLRQTILHLAVSGQLVPQNPSEGTGEELYRQIQLEKAELVNQGVLKKQKPLPNITEDEIPFAIPSGWEWTRIGNTARTIGGNAFKSSDFTDVGVRVVRISDFNENGFTSHRVVRVSEASTFEMYRIYEDDILMCMTGGTVGKTYYVKVLPEDMLLNQRVAIILSLIHI